ncbi:MAG: carboxypeptidase-like regulatory domain-containing protein [Phycisphaeraceae bacterium]|nr:carboxypeptidase-like regulatory domain-containing protein [Phycisphaeraceae bacterium]
MAIGVLTASMSLRAEPPAGVKIGESPAASTPSLSGVIVAGEAAEPLTDIKLLLETAKTSQARGSAVTDTEGRFRFENLQPGPYRLRIYCADAAAGEPLDLYYLPPKIGPLTIRPGKDLTLRIHVRRGLSLSGRVEAKGKTVTPRSPLYRNQNEIRVLDGQVSSAFAAMPKRIEFKSEPFTLNGLNPEAPSIRFDVAVSGVRPLCRVKVTGGPFGKLQEATLSRPIRFPPLKDLSLVVWNRPEQLSRKGVWVEIRGIDNPFHRYVNAMEVRNDPWPLGRYGIHVRYDEKRSPAFMKFTLSASKGKPGVFRLDYPRYAKMRKWLLRKLDRKAVRPADDYVEMKIPIERPKSESAPAPSNDPPPGT